MYRCTRDHLSKESIGVNYRNFEKCFSQFSLASGRFSVTCMDLGSLREHQTDGSVLGRQPQVMSFSLEKTCSAIARGSHRSKFIDGCARTFDQTENGSYLKHLDMNLKVLALYLGQKSSRQFDLWFRQTARWTILLLLAVGIGSWAVVVHRSELRC